MLEALAAQAAQAGARFLYGNVLFLMPSAMKQFMPFLEKEFPQLVKRYRKLYAQSAYLRGEYPEKISHLMAELRARYGLDGNRGDLPPPRAIRKWLCPSISPSPGVEAPPALTACHNGL